MLAQLNNIGREADDLINSKVLREAEFALCDVKRRLAMLYSDVEVYRRLERDLHKQIARLELEREERG